MSVTYSNKTKVFTLQTAHSTYQLKIGAYDYLLHLYYGEKIRDDDTSYLIRRYDRSFSPNPYEAQDDRTFSLDTLPQEFTSSGVGDYRVRSIEVQNADGSFVFAGKYRDHKIYKGEYRPDGLPYVWAADGDTVDTLEVTLQDDYTGLRVVLIYSVFEEKDIIVRSARYENTGKGTIMLNRAMSMCIDFLESDFDFIHFDGRHMMEREPHREVVSYGTQSIASGRGTSSHQHNPFVILCDRGTQEEFGNCYGFCFVYSGNFQCEVHKDQFDQTRLTFGIHPHQFKWSLKPESVFMTPEVILAYSSTGLTHLSHLYHDVFRHNLCRSKYMNEPRPILLNSWEAAYFDFNQEKLLKIARSAKELGVDLFVLDDGWFGERDNDDAALGDWVEDPKKLPNGLRGLSDELKKEGLKLGIWVEPEMVSEKSGLYQAHPDWCLHVSGRPASRGRYQLVLDLTRRDVCNYIVDSVDRILSSADISYVKWDMNRSITDAWSEAAERDEQGEIYHRYMLGLYSVLDRLTTRWPDVLFEGCSGGGGRFDAGMLFYHPQIWCSDNTDAINRLKIQYGTTFAYPVLTMGSHVSACPNHQTGRSVPLKTRGIVAMSGSFGYELDASRMTEEEKAECRRLTGEYKKYQRLIFDGDYYRLTDPYTCYSHVAWAYVSKDKTEALANIVVIDKEGNDAQRYVKMRGLEPERLYHVEGFEKRVSGQLLMKCGLPISIMMQEYEAVTVHFVSE